MKHLSRWAYNNHQKSKIIIGLCHVLIIYFAINFGLFAYFEDILIPFWVVGFSAVFTGIAFYLFPPNKKRNFFNYTYWREKFALMLSVIAYALMIVVCINQFAINEIKNTDNQTFRVILMAKKYTQNEELSISKKEKRTLKKDFRSWVRNLKKQLKTIKKEYKQSNNKGLKGLKIFLAILVVLICIPTVAYLGCEYSCTGNPAYLAAIFGVVGLAILTIVGISKIGNKRELSDQNQTTNPG